MNQHEAIRGMLALAAAGALDDPGDLRRVMQHAETCPECRRELDMWRLYTRGLSQLPQPAVPANLMERTRARMLERSAAAANRQSSGLTLGALAGFSWAVSLAMWMVVRFLTGGVWNIAGVNVANLLVWSAISTVLVLITAGAAAGLLAGQRQKGTL